MSDIRSVEVTQAVLGSQTIELEGFGHEHTPGHWMLPELRHISAHQSPEGIVDELTSRSRAVRWTRRGIAFFIVLCLVSMAFWFGVDARPAPTEASSQWYVGGVGAQGVIVNSDAVALLVAPGELLPNGEMLQAVIPERSTYVTDRATVIVQTNRAANGVGVVPASGRKPAATKPGQSSAAR